MSGIDLGGLTEDEATAVLMEYVSDKQGAPIKLTGSGRSWDIVPAEAGASVDVAGAVSAAMAVTRESNFFVDLGRRWKLYFSERDLPLQTSVDKATLDSLLADIAAELEVEPVDAGLAVEGGEVKITGGLNGQTVDQGALRALLEPPLASLQPAEIEIPLIVTRPDVLPEDHQAALDQAKTMISGPVTLKDGENSWTLSAAAIIEALQFSSEMVDGEPTLVPVLSAPKLSGFLAEIAPLVVKEPVDATFDSDGEKAWVVPAKPGEKLDPEGTRRRSGSPR